MEEYRFERLEEKHYADIVAIMKAAFGSAFGVNFFKKKQQTDYLGKKHLGFIAYSNTNEPASFYGVYPYRMEYDGKTYLAAQSGDTMTDPKHAGKGLFTSLARLTYNLAREEGIQFIFGFPNKNSYPGFIRKLNWKHPENMILYSVKVKTLPIAALTRRFPIFDSLYRPFTKLIISLYKSDAEFVPNSVISKEFGGVYRDSLFSNYKSFNNNHIIALSDRNAWVKVDGALLVGDIEIKQINNAETVLADLKRIAFWLGCSKVVFPVTKGIVWDDVFRNKMKSEDGIAVGYLDLQSGLSLEKFKYVLADHDTF